jgi:tripartite-type tricarboxylate transporter receptor subunit TctC
MMQAGGAAGGAQPVMPGAVQPMGGAPGPMQMPPTGTPKEITTKINAEIVKILSTNEIKDRFVALGAELLSSTPDEFGAYIKSETAKWGKVIKESGAKAD